MKKINLFVAVAALCMCISGCNNNVAPPEVNDAAPTANASPEVKASAAATTPKPAETPDPDFIPLAEAQKKWADEYEREKKPVDGLVLEIPGYKRVEVKYFHTKLGEYGVNRLVLEMDVTNLGDLDFTVQNANADIMAKTVNGNSVGNCGGSFMEKPEPLSNIRVGGTVRIIKCVPIDNLEDDVELTVSNGFQQLSNRGERSPERSEKDYERSQQEKAILPIK